MHCRSDKCEECDLLAQPRPGALRLRADVRQHLGAADRAQQRREVLNADALARELAAEEPRGRSWITANSADDVWMISFVSCHLAVTTL